MINHNKDTLDLKYESINVTIDSAMAYIRRGLNECAIDELKHLKRLIRLSEEEDTERLALTKNQTREIITLGRPRP